MTRAYRPGRLARAQPSPQLTIPASTISEPSATTSGPPLSPWHESLPPAVRPAASWSSVSVCPYAALAADSAMTGTCTAWSWSGSPVAPSEVAPQPDTVVVTPAAVSAVGAAAVSGRMARTVVPLSVSGCVSSISAASLPTVGSV